MPPPPPLTSFGLVLNLNAQDERDDGCHHQHNKDGVLEGLPHELKEVLGTGVGRAVGAKDALALGKVLRRVGDALGDVRLELVGQTVQAAKALVQALNAVGAALTDELHHLRQAAAKVPRALGLELLKHLPLHLGRRRAVGAGRGRRRALHGDDGLCRGF